VRWQEQFVKYAQIFAGNAMKNAANIKQIIARNVQEFVNFVRKNARRWLLSDSNQQQITNNFATQVN